MAVDDLVLGLIKFGPLWFRIYRITLSDGKFMLRALKGGLPGEGWDGSTQHRFSGKTVDGKALSDRVRERLSRPA